MSNEASRDQAVVFFSRGCVAGTRGRSRSPHRVLGWRGRAGLAHESLAITRGSRAEPRSRSSLRARVSLAITRGSMAEPRSRSSLRACVTWACGSCPRESREHARIDGEAEIEILVTYGRDVGVRILSFVRNENFARVAGRCHSALLTSWLWCMLGECWHTNQMDPSASG